MTNLLRHYLLCATLLLMASALHAGDDPSTYSTTRNGLKYKVYKHGQSGKCIMAGHFVSCRWWLKTMQDSVITSSDAFGTTPEFEIKNPKGKYDVFEGFLYLCKGDSASMLINADSAYKDGLPAFAKHGDLLKYTVVILDDYKPREYYLMKKMMRQQQLKVDENLIRAYLKQNQIHDFHYTDSGVYYMIQQQGSMRKPQKGDTVLVNYTGYLLDGSKFDSNVLPDFHHVTPFKFKLGVGAVIPGWDMALPLFGLGGKGTIIIPSRYAYGPYGNGDAIKPDAILVFDIELLDIK